MTILDFTYLLMACAAVRVILAAAKAFFQWIINKFSAGKVRTSYKRLVAIVSPELHAKLKAHVLLLDMTITEYVLIAVTEKLKRESHG